MNVKEFMDALAASPVATEIEQPSFVDTGEGVSGQHKKLAAELDKQGRRDEARAVGG